MKEFYKFSVNYEEHGLGFWVTKYFSVYETPCYHYCIEEFGQLIIHHEKLLEGESIIQMAKRKSIRVHKIHKTCSRKAFDTREKAYKNFMFLKKRQLVHLQRDIKVVSRLLQFDESNSYSDLVYQDRTMLMPNTKGFIDENIKFD